MTSIIDELRTAPQYNYSVNILIHRRGYPPSVTQIPISKLSQLVKIGVYYEPALLWAYFATSLSKKQ